MQSVLLRPPLLAFNQVAQEQLWWDGGTGEITAHRSVSQLISCPTGKLHRVEVFFEKSFHYVQSALWLKIYRGDVATEMAGARSRPIRVVGPLIGETLSREGWFAFEFEPIEAGEGIYTLRFDAPDATTADAVSLRSSERRGTGLSIGGVRRPQGALLFRALCLRTGAEALLENFERFRRSTRELPNTVDYQPLMARLEMSLPCDLGCIMCARGLQPYRSSRDGPGFLTLERFNLLEELLPKFLWVTAFGLGEPFLNPEIIPILRKVRRSNPFAHVFISSNGNRLSEGAIETVVAERLIGDFQISIDGDGDTFERIRPGARYDAVLRSLERLLRAREKYGYTEMTIKVGALIMKQTAPRVYPYIKQMAALGVNRIVFGSPAGFHCEQLRLPNSDAWAEVYEQLLQAYGEIMGSATIIDGPFLYELAEWHRAAGRSDVLPEWSIGPCATRLDRVQKRATLCTIPWESLSLRANGTFGLCCNTARAMGGPEKGSLVKPWQQGRFYQAARAELVEGPLHRDCKLCLSGGLVSPDIITPPTYTSACLYSDPGDTQLADVIGCPLRADSPVAAWDERVIIEPSESPREGENVDAPEVTRWKLTGWVQGSVPEDSASVLGIAVDGVVRTLVPAPDERTGGRWTTWIEDGPRPADVGNVEIFRIPRQGGRQSWRRIHQSPPAARSSPAHGRNQLLPWAEGDSYPPPRGDTGLYGVVEGAEIHEGVVTLRGWVSDLTRARPVGRVLVLVNGQVVRAVKPWLHRMDVATAHGPGHLVSGFRIDFSITDPGTTQPLQIVLIAVNAQNDASSELLWPEKTCVLAHAFSLTKTGKKITAVTAERARGWCVQTQLFGNEPKVSGQRVRCFGLSGWFRRPLGEAEVSGRIHNVVRTERILLLQGYAYELSARCPARALEIYAGERELGKTSAGIWLGDAILGGRAYTGFTAVIPAEWIEGAPMASLRVKAVSRSGQSAWLPWSGEDVLSRHREEIVRSPVETTEPVEAES